MPQLQESYTLKDVDECMKVGSLYVDILIFSKTTFSATIAKRLSTSLVFHLPLSTFIPLNRCAPECINYLRFTSASDVWAFGVTLWEMFSYGFQPWAALTGQQILEAIDEPNFQVGWRGWMMVGRTN